MTTPNVSSTTHAINTSPSDLYASKNDYLITGDGVLSGGISVLYYFMQMLSEQADVKYSQMTYQADTSREAQSYANRVDSDIAQAAKKGDKGTATLNEDTYNYMKENNITVDGMTIDRYLFGFDDASSIGVRYEDSVRALDQGQLQAVKASLENVANQASDYVSQSQLQLQKIMQTYNVTVSMINSMQTMIADLNKAIVQNIR